ncbi:MAG: hypothetical protein WC614_05695 [bacterium]
MKKIIFLLLMLPISAFATFPEGHEIMGLGPENTYPIVPTVNGGNTFYFPEDADMMSGYVSLIKSLGVKYCGAQEPMRLDEDPPYFAKGVYQRLPSLGDSGTEIDLDNKKISYGPGSYADTIWSHCCYRPVWRNFLINCMKRAIDAGSEVGVYDIALLTASAPQCFCPQHNAGFKNWLDSKYDSLELAGMGIHNINTFDYADALRDSGWTANTFRNEITNNGGEGIWLWDEWQPFNYFTIQDFWNSLSSSLKNYSDSVYGRTFYITGNAWVQDARMCLIDSYMDYVSYEFFFESDYPVEANAAWTYKTTLSRGKRGDIWNKPTTNDNTDFAPLFMAEAYANGGFYTAGDNPNQRHIATKLEPILQMVASQPSLFDVDEYGDFGLIYSLSSWRHTASDSKASYEGAHRLLQDAHIPYDVIFGGDNDWAVDSFAQGKLNKYRAVVLPRTECLSNAQINMLLAYCNAGGILIGIGNVGTKNENGTSVTRTSWQNLFNGKIVNYGSGKVISWKSDITYGYETDTTGRGAVCSNFIVRTDSLMERLVCTNYSSLVHLTRLVKSTDSSQIIHLLNYNYNTSDSSIIARTNDTLDIKIPASMKKDSLYVLFYTPSLNAPREQSLNYTKSSGRVKFCIPRLDIWGIVKIGRLSSYEDWVGVPTLLQPSDSSGVASNTVTLYWSKTAGVSGSYKLLLSKYSDMSDTLFIDTLSDTTSQVVVPRDGMYYWKVEAINSQGRKSGLQAHPNYFVSHTNSDDIWGEVKGHWTKSKRDYIVVGDIWLNRLDSLYIDPGVTIKFDGNYKFKIKGYLDAVGTEDERILFTRNRISEDSRWGGLRFDATEAAGHPRVKYCTIEYGRARGSSPDRNGGGVYMYGSPVWFENNIIRFNKAEGDGGGICFASSYPNSFLKNQVYGNEAGGYGGGVYCSQGGPYDIYNSTIANNKAGLYGGVYSYGYSISAKNTIIYHNSPGSFYSSYPDSFTYSCVQGGLIGTGNIDQLPLFADTADGDFSLVETSPCVNTGDPDFYLIDPDGSRIDMGAVPFNWGRATFLPTLLSPADSCPAKNNVKFIWSSTVSSKGKYTFEIAMDSLFTTGITYVAIKDTTFTLAIPTSGLSYWRIEAFDSIASKWEVRSGYQDHPFKTFIDTLKPAIPNLIQPVNRLFTKDTTPTFVWRKVNKKKSLLDKGFVSSEEEASPSNDILPVSLFSNSAPVLASVLPVSHSFVPLRTNICHSERSEESQHIILGKLREKTIPLRQSRTFVTPVQNPTLPLIQNKGTTYKLEISPDSLFILNVRRYTISGDTNFTIPDTVALRDSLYFWRVEGIDGAGNHSGFQLAPFRFTIDKKSPVVAIIFPDSGSHLLPNDTARIRWTATDINGIDSISILFSKDNKVTFDTLIRGIKDSSSFKWTTPNITADSCYIIVKAYDRALNIGEDTGGRFRIGVIGAEDKDIPVVLYLNSPVPNPSCKYAGISFGIPAASADKLVSVKIYNISGALEKVIINDNLNPGRYVMKWDRKGKNNILVGNGIYFIEMKVEGFRKVRKLVLIGK